MVIKCITCGKEFRCKPSEVARGKRYCSGSCRSLAVGYGSRGSGKSVNKGDNGSNNGVMSVMSVDDEIWLDKIRKSIVQTGHAYRYDECGEAIGDYDVDGNFTEF